jgi:hypothetical protein
MEVEGEVEGEAAEEKPVHGGAALRRLCAGR